jgi:hypothetical protein
MNSHTSTIPFASSSGSDGEQNADVMVTHLVFYGVLLRSPKAEGGNPEKLIAA